MMNNYIFYTGEGYTFAPDNSSVENFQILAFVSAENMQSAKEDFFKNYSYFFEHGYSIEEVICKRIE